MKKVCGPIVAILAAWLCCGCSSFNREWKAAEATPAVAGSMQGRWEGTWNSEKTGHHGTLRCIMSPETNGVYNARFKATFFKIFSGSYSVPFVAHATNDTLYFTGSENLGKLFGGVYEYQGTATDTNFNATYKCSIDNGTFKMRRPWF